MLEEYQFNCPYCWQEISMLLETTGGSQSYIEDCEVCCRPIAISYAIEDGEITAFSSDTSGY